MGDLNLGVLNRRDLCHHGLMDGQSHHEKNLNLDGHLSVHQNGTMNYYLQA
jgi:hypothetical protein